jgi:hypothetical protein
MRTLTAEQREWLMQLDDRIAGVGSVEQMDPRNGSAQGTEPHRCRGCQQVGASALGDLAIRRSGITGFLICPGIAKTSTEMA